MNKTTTLVVSLVVIAVAGFVIHRNTLSYKAAHSGMIRTFPMQCGDCGKKFTMTVDEMNSLIRKGKVENQPFAYTQFPCPACGKTKSVINDGKYEKQPDGK
jgi:transcription elongation factor Elf1